jgi:glycosyltransferase involved in cell wall biosynthesis
MNSAKPVRVLYSFPHRFGADRICYTAWQQVNGLAAAGAQVTVMAASFERETPKTVACAPTLSRGRLRVPYRLLGSKRAFDLHDRIVAARLERMRGQFDIVHLWPLGALHTIDAARRLGIVTVMERPNAHTRFAYESVRDECERIGVPLPPDHEHAFNQDTLRIEEAEYAAVDRLLCPSDFVVKTFRERGIASDKLVRHFYGFDENVYFPSASRVRPSGGITMLFVGVCAVRKGLHLALEAWLASPAHRDGRFLIAGEFLPAYELKLAPMLAHPSIHVLGHRRDVAQLMRRSDVLVLPSIEEGFGLVCTEAMGSGCVPLVSDACTDLCRHADNALVHRAGDVATLTEHITLLHRDRAVLEDLRSRGLSLAPSITWSGAGRHLLDAYRNSIDGCLRDARRDAAALPDFGATAPQQRASLT